MQVIPTAIPLRIHLRSRERKMTRKILLSHIIILALILGGCQEGGDPVGADPVNPPVVVEPDPTEPKPPVDTYKVAGWYGKTQVSAIASNGLIYSHKTAGIFGELVQSDEEKDKHDIKSYGPSIFQVVFPQTEWSDEDNGYYLSNYKNYSVDSAEKKVWTFEVRHDVHQDDFGTSIDLKNANISITLDAVYDVTYIEKNGKVTYKDVKATTSDIADTLHLVDLDNDTGYTLTELKTANLNMDGQTVRNFRWVLGSVDSSDYQKTKVAMKKTTSFTKTETFTGKTVQITDEPRTGGKFGLPPQ